LETVGISCIIIAIPLVCGGVGSTGLTQLPFIHSPVEVGEIVVHGTGMISISTVFLQVTLASIVVVIIIAVNIIGTNIVDRDSSRVILGASFIGIEHETQVSSHHGLPSNIMRQIKRIIGNKDTHVGLDHLSNIIHVSISGPTPNTNSLMFEELFHPCIGHVVSENL
jgi:hypothetical protein